MFRRSTWLGAVIGAAAAAGVLALVGVRQDAQRPTGPALSECDGRLRALVIQYEPAGAEAVEPVYRQFLSQLRQDVTVYAVCPDQAAFDRLRGRVGEIPPRLEPILVGHAMTSWARDRWVALAPKRPGRATTLWLPRGEAGASLRAGRAGDERIGQDIAAALAPRVQALRSELYFDAGDFLADGENVFIVPRVLDRNIQNTVADRQEFLRLVGSALRRPVVLLEDAPEHHAGMFMMSVGGRTMLVGDPSLARALTPAATTAPASAAFPELPGGADFTLQTQRRFDAVARQCQAEGYTVVRIPVVPATDGRTFLTYVNAIIDRDGPNRIVYMPCYRGAEPLNAAAEKVWQGLGYEVRPIDCTSVYRHFGCLHCLVNVLERQ